MGEPKRPDMKRWQEHRAVVFRDPRPSGSVYVSFGTLGASPDAVLLVSLVPMVTEARYRMHLADVHLSDVDAQGHLTLLLPSAGWVRPGQVEGAQLLGMPVRLDDHVEWPSLLWEIP